MKALAQIIYWIGRTLYTLMCVVVVGSIVAMAAIGLYSAGRHAVIEILQAVGVLAGLFMILGVWFWAENRRKEP